MVPRVVKIRRSLPKTSHGKIDRRALRDDLLEVVT